MNQRLAEHVDLTPIMEHTFDCCQAQLRGRRSCHRALAQNVEGDQMTDGVIVSTSSPAVTVYVSGLQRHLFMRAEFWGP